ncbi:MAG: nitrile hydratase subunit beta [Alphaproteobacteria bacterium]|nr:nitrile hydratase subunit beta [Alphaproteobacteria bacterium]
MNGIHDMGGMQDMGPIQYEKGEPVFHALWESRVLAMVLAAFAWHKWNLDAFRHTREVLPPEDYLRLSYYEQWFSGLRDLLVRRGLVTAAEIEPGVPAPGAAKANPPLTADKINPVVLSTRIDAQRDLPVSPRFKLGEQVRARNLNPVGHTRLPRYARGKVGTIHRDHGVFIFPDTNAHFVGETPQHVYSVRFAARELWGAQGSEKDCVYLDMWDDYLDPA